MLAQPTHVTIKLEGDTKFEGFNCRGRSRRLCDGCRLRFLCLSEKHIVVIPIDVVKKHKIKDMRSLVTYIFGEGRISYELKIGSKSGESTKR